jgi:hypothetical protein
MPQQHAAARRTAQQSPAAGFYSQTRVFFY